MTRNATSLRVLGGALLAADLPFDRLFRVLGQRRIRVSSELFLYYARRGGVIGEVEPGIEILAFRQSFHHCHRQIGIERQAPIRSIHPSSQNSVAAPSAAFLGWPEYR